jgi:phage FluMu protein Com
MITHTCFKCGRHFELEPVFVGLELHKLKKKNPTYLKATCPACKSTNKVSVRGMKAELDAAATEITAAIQRVDEEKARQKAAKKEATKEATKAKPKAKARS